MQPIAHPVFLYVEDDPMSREIMQLLLQMKLGYPHVFLLEDSADFVERLAVLSPAPNVFLLDIHVTPLDGFAMLRLLRRQAAYADATIIALTASVMSEEVRALQEAGFDSIIAKPVDQKRFGSQIAAILRAEAIWQV